MGCSSCTIYGVDEVLTAKAWDRETLDGRALNDALRAYLLAHLWRPNRDLTLDEEVLHRGEPVALGAERGHLELGVADARAVLAEVLHMALINCQLL